METLISVHSDSSKMLLLKKIFLTCGIISSVYYIALNIIIPLQDPEYNVVSQTVSELSAIDAPTRSMWVFLCTFYSFFILAFGSGVWMVSDANKWLRYIAKLLFVYGVSGFFWPPMHLRSILASGGGTISDTLHIAFAMGTVFLMILMIGFGAAALGKVFRYYSITTLLLLFTFGILTSLESPGVPKNLPTPMIGVWERINIGVFLIWVIVLALILLRTRTKQNGITHKYQQSIN